MVDSGRLLKVAEGCHVRKGGCCAWREAVGEAELGHDSETTEEARLTCFQQGRIILIMMMLTDLCNFVVHRGHWAPLGACAAHGWPRSRRRAFRNIIRQLDGCGDRTHRKTVMGGPEQRNTRRGLLFSPE